MPDASGQRSPCTCLRKAGAALCRQSHVSANVVYRTSSNVHGQTF
ncbi:hypothetical protein [Polaromonas sp. CG9_12]|nr:hypothetical protein [Polaromonas sp. CG9_12]